MEQQRTKNIAAHFALRIRTAATPATFLTGATANDDAYYKDGAGAWTALAITDTFVEIGSTGMYEISLTAAEMNHDQIIIKVTAALGEDDFILISTIPAAANLKQIDEQTTDGNNATLNLKKVNIVNNAGDAFVATATGSNGAGIKLLGHGTGHGFHIESGTGAAANAIHAEAKSTNGVGIRGMGTGTAQGMYLTSGTGVDANAFEARGMGTGQSNGFLGAGSGATGAGIYGAGTPGLRAKGDSDSHGVSFEGSGSGGIGLRIIGSAFGTGSAGMEVLGGAVGNQDALRLIGFGTGKDINSDQTDFLDALISSRATVAGVWDEATAGHSTAGTTGKALTDAAAGGSTPAAIADAVWDEARSGHVAAGSFGEGVANVQGNVTGSVGSVTGAVGSVAVGGITAASIATDAIDGDALAASAVSEIQSGLATLANQSAIISGLVAINADTDDIQTRLPAALVGGKIDANMGSKTSTVGLSAQEKLDVNAEVVDVEAVDTMPELAVGIPPATPTSRQAKMLQYMALRNKTTTMNTEFKIFNDAGTGVAKQTLGETSGVFTREEMVGA